VPLAPRHDPKTASVASPALGPFLCLSPGLKRDYRKGLPRLRALGRMTVIERFSETAVNAADEPLSISTTKCVSWAGVHFRLPMRTMWPNPKDHVSFRSD